MNRELAHELSRSRVLTRRRHPELLGAIDAARRSGDVVSLLPGVYAAAGDHHDWLTRCRAVPAWDADAILTGDVAAALTFAPNLGGPDLVDVVTRRRGQQSGYRYHRWTVPPEQVVRVGGLPITSPALTALWLIPERGPDIIDQALRSRMVTLDGLKTALADAAHRPGNQLRSVVLHDSRDDPWSAAERLAHRLLRDARIVGWRGNFAVACAGRRYVADIAFPAERVIIEIDGYAHHGSAAAFESDRSRQNDLVLAGWRVLRFTWAMLQENPTECLRAVRAALGR